MGGCEKPHNTMKKINERKKKNRWNWTLSDSWKAEAIKQSFLIFNYSTASIINVMLQEEEMNWTKKQKRVYLENSINFCSQKNLAHFSTWHLYISNISFIAVLYETVYGIRFVYAKVHSKHNYFPLHSHTFHQHLQYFYQF